jgi:dTDP-4-dehydrorhamnose 3,5-epimerase-like enzyme
MLVLGVSSGDRQQTVAVNCRNRSSNVALVNVLSGNKERGLWIQRHMTNGAKNTGGQRRVFFFCS